MSEPREVCEVEPDRREFLCRATEGLAGAVFMIAAGDAAVAAGAGRGATVQELQESGSSDAEVKGAGTGDEYDPTEHRYAYVIDVTKCIGCGSCVRACEVENDVPEGYFRTWIERYEVSRTGEVHVDSPDGGRNSFGPLVSGEDVTKAFFVPKICNHCTETPCVQLCPVGASYRSPDGVILVDAERCIGCGYCVQACPYGSRFLHPETHIASKCTLCYHRITKGLLPACVQACPTHARKFGDLKKPGDEVAEILATENVHVLKPTLMTKPNCHYVGLSEEVR